MIKTFCILLVLIPFAHAADIDSSTELLKKMYQQNHGKWYKTFHFVQTTERYRNDSLISTQTWYETIVFPDLFRMDFGNPKDGNGVIYARDSSFRFRQGKLIDSRKDENELIFFLGGMYFRSFDEVLKHFKELNYDLSKFYKTSWNGQKIYVIGASSSDEKVNQLWIDADKLFPVRFFKYEGNGMLEGTFENIVSVKNGLTLTKASFYFNDKLVQVENYKDYVTEDPIDLRMFDPNQFGAVHWYKN